MSNEIQSDKLLKIVNLSTGNKLSAIGINNIQDLILYFPISYKNYTKFHLVKDLKLGMMANVEGVIIKNDIIIGHKKNILICFLHDKSGTLVLRFFHFTSNMQKTLSIGKKIIVHGKIRSGFFGNEIIHPKYWNFNTFYKNKLSNAKLTPIYPKIKGIKQTTLHNIINQALKTINSVCIKELLPKEISNNFMNIKDALSILHNPPSETSLYELNTYSHPAQKRLILEEILSYNIKILKIKYKIQKQKSYPLLLKNSIFEKFLNSLPFSLTASQKRIINDIIKDLTLSTPMTRLLQGDVGSGKTILAALAAIYTISNGYQVALMAPTELLVEQHFYNFYRWFTPLNITVGCLSSKQNDKIRHIQQKNVSNGKTSIIVGTHAVLQKNVCFFKLALIIIDEQHRFGVNQRLNFLKKGIKDNLYPHQLIITATPIPRTLAMINYANFDHSIISENSSNKAEIITILISSNKRKKIISRIYKTCLNNKEHQVYWVCSTIKSSNSSEIKSVENTYKELKKIFSNIKIDSIHGNMRLKEKLQIIENFRLCKIQILVTSTIIEVGIDMPNVNFMIIENSERFGLTQLHQLRGRIGRGLKKSYCILLYNTPLSKIAKTRLKVIRSSRNGFYISQKDLEIRGHGDFFGIRQTGYIKFKIANLLRDKKYFLKTKLLANYMYKNYPNLSEALINRWMKNKNIDKFVI